MNAFSHYKTTIENMPIHFIHEPGKGPKLNRETNTELGNDPAAQLYHLANDRGEMNNLAATQPEKVKELAALLQQIKQAGRSRP